MRIPTIKPMRLPPETKRCSSWRCTVQLPSTTGTATGHSQATCSGQSGGGDGAGQVGSLTSWRAWPTSAASGTTGP
eukprot:3253416-Heterocapsa_arctica.AAC.1